MKLLINSDKLTTDITIGGMRRFTTALLDQLEATTTFRFKHTFDIDDETDKLTLILLTSETVSDLDVLNGINNAAEVLKTEFTYTVEK